MSTYYANLIDKNTDFRYKLLLKSVVFNIISLEYMENNDYD